jgi:hypothetical protein
MLPLVTSAARSTIRRSVQAAQESGFDINDLRADTTIRKYNADQERGARNDSKKVEGGGGIGIPLGPIKLGAFGSGGRERFRDYVKEVGVV